MTRLTMGLKKINTKIIISRELNGDLRKLSFINIKA
jgi:hypothetical protein